MNILELVHFWENTIDRFLAGGLPHDPRLAQ
jgi:hypothetical protein